MKNKKEWESINKKLEGIWNSRPISDKGYFDKYIKEIINKKENYLQSVKKFGTPLYVLDENELKQRAQNFIDVFKKEIPSIEFFYPFKCNDLPYLINILKKLGFKADVAGIFELELALKIGFDKIIFSSPGKDKEELMLALKNKGRVIISIDNLDELDTILEIVKKNNIENVNISFRLNPKGELSAPWSKFGLTLEELSIGFNKIKNSELKCIGLHFHSSWNETPEVYVQNIELIGEYLENNKKNISNLKFLDIGGGFYPESEGTLFKALPKGRLLDLLDYEEIRYKTDFDAADYSVSRIDISAFAKEIAKVIKNSIFPIKKIAIYCEPGRFITKHSTRIMTKVLAIKDNGCIADAGTYTLLGENSLAEYEYTPILNLSNPSPEEKKYHIYGSLCAPYDIWGYSYYGNKIKKGDLLLVFNQGAYTFSFAQRFIKPIARYIVITKDNRLICAKEKEKFEDRYRKCKLKF